MIIIMLQQGLWFLSGGATEKKLFGEGAEEGCIFKKKAKYSKQDLQFTSSGGRRYLRFPRSGFGWTKSAAAQLHHAPGEDLGLRSHLKQPGPRISCVLIALKTDSYPHVTRPWEM